jgi:geranylgeranyl pyrophosphate synthase
MSASFERFLADGAARARALGGEVVELWDALTEAADGGARMRPTLIRAAYEAFGGRDAAAAERLGAAVELLHTAFVVHDDVIDHDVVRRGRLNVSGAFVARAVADGVAPHPSASYANAAGILAGDLALVGALLATARVSDDPDVAQRLLALVDEAVLETAAGELDDVRASLGVDELDERQVLRTAERKTAAYSFSLPLRAAAVLAGADEQMQARLDRLARRLGVAFQLRDDLLGVFGDEDTIGKSALSDLREGKATALVAHARTTPQWPELSTLVGDPHLTASGAARARELLVRCGARAHVEALVDDDVAAARDQARRLGLGGVLEPWLSALATVSGRAA